MRRRYPAAVYAEQTDEHGDRRTRSASRARAQSKSPATIPACWSSSKPRASCDLAHNIIARYVHEEIDAAYIVYNEFKSVIAQRLVVEKLLPLIEARQRSRSPAPSSRPPKSRERAAEAALSAGIDHRARRHRRSRRRSQEIRHRRTSTTSTSSRPRSSSPACCRSTFSPCSSTP